MTIKEILEFNFLNVGGYHLNLLDLIEATIIIMVARFLLWFIGKLLQRVFKRNSIDLGRQFAIKQFIKYIVYIFTFLAVVRAVGIELSLLWAGSAALLVGIGLGLQEMFTNLVSGIILLIEGTVEVGDVLVVDGMVGKVSKIGIRTSKIENRDGITVIVPNSKLVTNNVVNWSHNRSSTRFNITVGVSYSSDVQLVTQLILEVAKKHSDVISQPPPQVQFVDFGSSSLDFVLYFFSNEFWRIEAVKSDLRYSITQAFRANNIEIPFPQRDLWLRNPETLMKS